MANSIQLDLDFGAICGFLGYLQGNVVELTVSGPLRQETFCVVVDCEADAGGAPGVKVRRFDDELGRPDGDSFVIDLDEVVGISLY